MREKRPVVFIHTNEQQMLGARVAAHSIRSGSTRADRFEIRLLRLEETPHLSKRDGQRYVRKGIEAVWNNRDLQSFSPLRREVPQLMGYAGRALVLDPDVFAVGDLADLLFADMGGQAILCRWVPEGYQGNDQPFFATSVMLLDCAKLTHWRWNEEIDAMFEGKLDYGPWISLRDEDPATIGHLDECWNSFDHLDESTKLLHLTERSTQPWKTGLPVDFDLNLATTRRGGPFARLVRRLSHRGARSESRPARYQPHPDPNQERFFFSLLKNALETGSISEEFVREKMESSDVRADAFEALARIGYRGSQLGAEPATR